MISDVGREYGIVILLDALGTSQRIISDIDKFIEDWDSVLDKLSQNVDILERELASRRYRTGIIIKDIFENIGVIAGETAMRVLNNKSYSSSPRFYHFVKYRIPIKEPTRKRRRRFDR